MEILISTSTSKPIYEQITSQIKAQIMSGALQPGEALPSMRALAKSIHVSVITVQKAYEDLQRDGFIETTVGRGTFVAPLNRDFYRRSSSARRRSTCCAQRTSGRTSGIPLETLLKILTMFYQEGE